MELLDIRNEAGDLTGRVAARGTPLLPGEYHLAVHVWIRNEIGEYLVQRRALHLLSGPGIWATTVGYVLAGEDSISGAIRETNEELGIQLLPASLKWFSRLVMDHRIEDHWLAEVSKQSIGEPAPGPEVIDWQWASKSQLQQMINRGEFFAYRYFETLPG